MKEEAGCWGDKDRASWEDTSGQALGPGVRFHSAARLASLRSAKGLCGMSVVLEWPAVPHSRSELGTSDVSAPLPHETHQTHFTEEKTEAQKD